MKINRYALSTMSPEQVRSVMRRSETDITALFDTIRPVVEAVRDEGDAALRRYTAQFDRADIPAERLRATPEEFAAAREALEPEVKAAIERSAQNIRRFHEAQMPDEMWFTEVSPGIMAGEKITPITSVGLYVPRGKGSFPSVMLMLGLPAVIAQVPQIVVCTPPRPDGLIDDATLFAAEVCGIDAVYRVGGSQAIAALAYGTETVPKVAKTLGPGSSYVSAAKRLLYGQIDVGTPAGPSESIILCDESIDPKIAALDLLIEAEHGPDSCALLVTHASELADRVVEIIPELVAELPEERQRFISTVLSNYGGIVQTDSLAASLDFVNDFAPEHLEVLTAEPMITLSKIKNAGEVLLGKYSPITIGNFSLGVNAILPTGGFAKSFSCVTVFDYLKRTSIGYVSEEGYREISETARRFAEYEGFSSHAAAIAKRPL